MRHADILIIGAGAVGTAIARELAKYELSIIVCDKNEDVGGDASKSCSSCVATAATMPEGTLEQKLRELSHPMVYEICEELDVPIERCGSLTVAISQKQLDGIPAWIAKAKRNGVHDAQVLTREELLKMEPALNPDVREDIVVRMCWRYLQENWESVNLKSTNVEAILKYWDKINDNVLSGALTFMVRALTHEADPFFV